MSNNVKNAVDKFLFILIPFGIFCFLVSSVFYFLDSKNFLINQIYLVSIILQFVISAILIFCAIKYTKKAFQLYIGLIMLVWGVISVLVHSVDAFSMSQWWPVLLFAAGLLLLICGFYKYRHIKFGYAIPAFTFLGMGIWFSLFSFHIIKIPFLTVAGTLGPVFMLFIAIVLVLYFIVQQKHKELVVSDEEIGTFSDEEVISPKND